MTAMLSFTPLAIHPDVPTYGAVGGSFTFIITVKHGKYLASVKKLGAMKFDGTRTDLGLFYRFVDAAKACEKYLHEQLQ